MLTAPALPAGDADFSPWSTVIGTTTHLCVRCRRHRHALESSSSVNAGTRIWVTGPGAFLRPALLGFGVMADVTAGQNGPVTGGSSGLFHNWKYVLATTNPPHGRFDPVSKWLYLTRAGVLR